jgi:hypothetical protein
MRRTARWVDLANTVLAPASAKARRAPDAVFAKLLARAEADAGASAEGDETFVDGYRDLLHRFAAIDTFSFIGWNGTVGEFKLRLENRLRVRRLIAETPAIADEPIDRPIVVVGLPRTATTLAHKVIAQPEGNRAPLMWEFRSIDRADIDPKLRAKRRKEAARLASMVRFTTPIWPDIHETGADTPEECVLALPHGLHWGTRGTLPGYREWLTEHDYTPDYEYLKQVLQVLQYGTPRRRWVLKSPFHLYNLDTLLKVFPDAKIMWTHRDPQTVMGSWCSLIETGLSLFHQTYDPTAIGREWLEQLPWMVEQGRAQRAVIPKENFIDVSYHQLTGDPPKQLPLIFERLGLAWTAAEDRNLDAVLARPGMRRNHEYALAHYGIDPYMVEEAFGDYSLMVASMR